MSESKNINIPDIPAGSIILSPDHLADDLLSGSVILGCAAVDDEFVLLNHVYVVRDDILFVIRVTPDRELHLSGILIATDEDYKNQAFMFYYANDSCYVDKSGLIDLSAVQYIQTDYPVDVKAALCS